MKSLPLSALRAFAALYLTGGVRPAGRLLGVAHSSIARHLSELEAEAGTPLLERGQKGRALVFTPTGEKLGRDAAQSFKMLNAAWDAVRERKTPNSVSISTPASFAALWLLPKLSQLSVEHPRIEVSVLAEQRVRGPKEEGCDFAIRMGDSTRSDEVAMPFMDDALTPLVSPNMLNQMPSVFRAGINQVDDMSVLSHLPLLHDRDPNTGWDRWTKVYGPTDLDLAKGPRYASSDLLLRAAKQGRGVVLARMRLAEEDLLTGALVRVSKHMIPLPRAYTFIHRTDQAPRAAVKLVQDWLLMQAADVPTLLPE